MKKLIAVAVLMGTGAAWAVPLEITGKPGFALPQGSTFKDNYNSQLQLAVAVEARTEGWVKPVLELGYNAGHNPEEISGLGAKVTQDGGELSITYLTPAVKVGKTTQAAGWKLEPFALGGLGIFGQHKASGKTKVNGVQTGTFASSSGGGWALNLGAGVGVQPNEQFTVAFDLRYQIFADKLSLTNPSDLTTKRENPTFLTPGVAVTYKF